MGGTNNTYLLSWALYLSFQILQQKNQPNTLHQQIPQSNIERCGDDQLTNFAVRRVKHWGPRPEHEQQEARDPRLPTHHEFPKVLLPFSSARR